MAHQEGHEDEHLGDNWFSSFEQECLGDMENSDSNMEETLQRQNDFAQQKLFLQFQNSATAIAQLYKGNCIFLVSNNYFLIIFRFRHVTKERDIVHLGHLPKRPWIDFVGPSCFINLEYKVQL